MGNGPVTGLCAGCDDVPGDGPVPGSNDPVATGIAARSDDSGITPSSTKGVGRADSITAAHALLAFFVPGPPRACWH